MTQYHQHDNTLEESRLWKHPYIHEKRTPIKIPLLKRLTLRLLKLKKNTFIALTILPMNRLPDRHLFISASQTPKRFINARRKLRFHLETPRWWPEHCNLPAKSQTSPFCFVRFHLNYLIKPSKGTFRISFNQTGTLKRHQPFLSSADFAIENLDFVPLMSLASASSDSSILAPKTMTTSPLSTLSATMRSPEVQNSEDKT